MKIKLIEPSWYLPGGKLARSRRYFFPSLTLPYLAALAPPDHALSIIQEQYEDIDFSEDLDLVGITSYTYNIKRAYEIADEFRKKRIPVVMGGIHVSMAPEEAGEHADAIIAGEAEETWPEFLDDFQKGKPQKFYEPKHRPSLQGLPLPRFDLVNKANFLGYAQKSIYRLFFHPQFPIQTARGCPHSCEFCSVAKLTGSQYRTRPIPEVINEIKALQAKLIFFVDDNIFASRSRAKELLRALIPLKVKWFGQGATIAAAADKELLSLARKSGCLGVAIGLESISQKNLQSVGKNVNRIQDYEKHLKAYRKEKINVTANMIFGFENETQSIFKETFDFLVRNRVPYAFWQPLTPYPGTQLYQRLKDQGFLKNDRWWLGQNNEQFANLKHTAVKMSEEEFSGNFLAYLSRFYSLKNIMRRTLVPPKFGLLRTLTMNVVHRNALRGPLLLSLLGFHRHSTPLTDTEEPAK